MHFKRLGSMILVAALLAVHLAGCAPTAPEPTSFMLNESVSLTREMHKQGSQVFSDLAQSSVPDFWAGLVNADPSSPDNAVIITIDPDLVTDFLTQYQQLELKEYSDEMIAFFAPKTTTGLTSMIFAILIDAGYSIPSLSTSGLFSVTHINKAPPELGNAVVFMDFDGCTSITTFSRYDDYTDCSCRFIIPDMTSEELLDRYAAFFKNSFGKDFTAGHTEIIDAAQLRGIVKA